jgi:pimeloyl-ACP methyl ester carboxylesterase
MSLALLSLLLAAAHPAVAPHAAAAPHAPAAVIADPPHNAAHPAGVDAFVIPSHGSPMNAVLYTAAGDGPHPTLLLLHGFPGNEQNLDLAQAARRAGWNVLTFHYRGAWGSGGAFSFAHCVEDTAAALAYLRQPEVVARDHIDPKRIAIAGHSMGGMMAARAGADDPAIIGVALIDPWDIADTGRSFATSPEARAAFGKDVESYMPALAGTNPEALLSEVEHADARLDLIETAPALASRPLLIVGAARGIGRSGAAAAVAARVAGGKQVTAETLPTDHSFSDMRIALASRLVNWLQHLPAH